MVISEKDLILGIKQSNQKAFELVFKQYFAGLCYFARTYLNDKITAEDIVEEVFYKFWEQRSVIDITVSLKSYLYKSVQNHCLNYLKHLSVEEKYKNLKQTTSVEIPENGEEITSWLLAAEIEAKFESAVNTLPQQCKHIFELNRYEKMKYHEIASHLRISVKTVETQMSRAINKIRIALKDYLT